MQSYKIDAYVREDHQLVATLPADFPAGEIEILVQSKTSIRRNRTAPESGAAIEAGCEELWTNEYRLDTAAAGHLRTVTL